MDEKQILKEIAYYSRIINQHKTWSQWNCLSNKYVKPSTKPHVHFNKYKYVKRGEPSTVIRPVQSNVVSNKVLINPNFKARVHINPHFHPANQPRPTIHVNPKVLTQQLSLTRGLAETKTTTVASATSALPGDPKSMNSVVPKVASRKRRCSIRSKYKIVKSSVLNTSVKTPPANKRFTVASKYKIDHRHTSVPNKTIAKKRSVRYGLSDLVRNQVFANRTWKKTRVLNHFKANSAQLTNISGILYRKSHTKLQKVDETEPKLQCATRENSKHRKRVVNIKGVKYVMDSRTLKLVASSTCVLNSRKQCGVRKISVKGLTFVQRTRNTYVRRNVPTENPRRLKLRTTSISGNSLCKNNVPCPVYRRFGKCRRRDAGRCKFLHNPDQIFLCKKFLQGACLDNDCLLSHKVSLEKMPTCKYFLEGCCIRTDCPYSHVKINPKADICRKFLEGFCKDGNKCNKRHQFLCPNFERDGQCPRRKCVFPHKAKTEKDKPVPINRIVIRAAVVRAHVDPEPSVEPAPLEPARYYVDVRPCTNSDAPGPATKDAVPEVSDSEPSCELDPDTEVRRRPQLGALPSFIPFD